MMMNYRLIIFIICSFYFVSCSKNFLDKEPNNSVSNETLLTTKQGIQSALNGCYNDLQSYNYYGRNFILINEVYSDNAKLSKNNLGNFSSFYNYSVTTDNDELTQFWATAYRIIANSNNILKSISKINDFSEIEKNTIIGEALTLRSLVYFDLVRMFAHSYTTIVATGILGADGKGGNLGVPLVTEPITKDSAQYISRSTVSQVYKQIIIDLTLADSLLASQTFSPFYCNQKLAESLLSFIYLSKKDYNNAITYADKVIGSMDLVTSNEYIDSWGLESTSESIFSIAMNSTDYPGTNSIGHMLSPEGYGGLIPTQDLISLYKSNDIRLQFIKNVQENYFIKFGGRNGVLGLDNIPIIRLSELYFVIAESYAQKGKNVAGFYPLAQDALEQIVHRAENSSVPITVEGDELTNKIYDEYQKEFAFEGKRFFQLKRLGKSIERNDCSSSICNISYPNNYYAFPIPNSELHTNKNIIQNPGY